MEQLEGQYGLDSFPSTDTPYRYVFHYLHSISLAVFCHSGGGCCRVRLYRSKQTDELMPVLATRQSYNLLFWSMLVQVIIAAVCQRTQRFQQISSSAWQLFEVGNHFYLYYMGKEPKPREVKIIYLSSHEKSVRKRALLSFISDLSSAPHTRLLR